MMTRAYREIYLNLLRKTEEHGLDQFGGRSRCAGDEDPLYAFLSYHQSDRRWKGELSPHPSAWQKYQILS